MARNMDQRGNWATREFMRMMGEVKAYDAGLFRQMNDAIKANPDIREKLMFAVSNQFAVDGNDLIMEFKQAQRVAAAANIPWSQVFSEFPQDILDTLSDEQIEKAKKQWEQKVYLDQEDLYNTFRISGQRSQQDAAGMVDRLGGLARSAGSIDQVRAEADKARANMAAIKKFVNDNALTISDPRDLTSAANNYDLNPVLAEKALIMKYGDQDQIDAFLDRQRIIDARPGFNPSIPAEPGGVTFGPKEPIDSTRMVPKQPVKGPGLSQLAQIMADPTYVSGATTGANMADDVVNYGARGDADVGAKALKNLDKMMGKGSSIIDQMDAKAKRDARRAAAKESAKAKLAAQGGVAAGLPSAQAQLLDPATADLYARQLGPTLGETMDPDRYGKGQTMRPNRNDLRKVLSDVAKTAADPEVPMAQVAQVADDLYPTQLLPAGAMGPADLMPGSLGGGMGATELLPGGFGGGMQNVAAGPGRMQQVAALASQANGMGGRSGMIGGFNNVGPQLVDDAARGAGGAIGSAAANVADDAVRYGLDDFLAAGAGAVSAGASGSAGGVGGAAPRNVLGRNMGESAKALLGKGFKGGALKGTAKAGALGIVGGIGGQFVGNKLDQQDFGGENSYWDRFARNAAVGAGTGLGVGAMFGPYGAAAGTLIGGLGYGLLGGAFGNTVTKDQQINDARSQLMAALAYAPDEVRNAFAAQFNMQAPMLSSGRQATGLAQQIAQQAAATSLAYEQEQQQNKARLAFQGQLGALFTPYLDQANEGAYLSRLAMNRAADTLESVDPAMASIYRARAANREAGMRGMTAGYAAQMANPDLATQLGVARQLAAQQQQQYINEVAAQMSGTTNNNGSALTQALAASGVMG